MKPEKKERQKPEELIHPRSPRVKRPEGAATGGSQRGLHRIPQILLWFARFPGVSAPRGSRIPEITGTARPRLKAESDPRSSTIRIRTSGKKGSSSAGSGKRTFHPSAWRSGLTRTPTVRLRLKVTPRLLRSVLKDSHEAAPATTIYPTQVLWSSSRATLSSVDRV